MIIKNVARSAATNFLIYILSGKILRALFKKKLNSVNERAIERTPILFLLALFILGFALIFSIFWGVDKAEASTKSVLQAKCLVLANKSAPSNLMGASWVTCYKGMPSSAPRLGTNSGYQYVRDLIAPVSSPVITSNRAYRKTTPIIRTRIITRNLSNTFPFFGIRSAKPIIKNSSPERVNFRFAGFNRTVPKKVNSLTPNKRVKVSSGAYCVTSSSSQVGCFPIKGTPSQYSWTSYAKGTCIAPIGPKQCRYTPIIDHQALDIEAPLGTPVYSIWGGNVINAHFTEKDGNIVVIEYPKQNLATVYKHLNYGSLTVKRGDIVKAGSKVGEVGNTGSLSFSPHLHFRIHKSNTKAWKLWRWEPLTEYEIVALYPFKGIKKGMFWDEHKVSYAQNV